VLGDEVLRHVLRDAHEALEIKEADAPDLRTRHPPLVGDGAHDIPHLDAGVASDGEEDLHLVEELTLIV
jgi:hypothetical protein